jgi:hypothetical protein
MRAGLPARQLEVKQRPTDSVGADQERLRRRYPAGGISFSIEAPRLILAINIGYVRCWRATLRQVMIDASTPELLIHKPVVHEQRPFRGVTCEQALRRRVTNGTRPVSILRVVLEESAAVVLTRSVSVILLVQHRLSKAQSVDTLHGAMACSARLSCLV